MPSKSTPFTPSSILFRPRKRRTDVGRQGQMKKGHYLFAYLSPVVCRLSSELVESPGTAPGSEWFITTAIYRHSRLAPALKNISANGCRKKTGAERIIAGWPEKSLWAKALR